MVLIGARRVGKTLFLEKLIKENIKEPILKLNGEDILTIEILSQISIENYIRLIGKNKVIIIDEAQHVPKIGQILKFIVDNIKGIKIIVTSSSDFDLTNQLGEPLTGRKITFYLYPLAQMEFSENENIVQTKARLEERLIYGTYPELIHYQSNDEKAFYLKELVNSYLLKDILMFEGVKKSSKIITLLRLLAFQIGKEVSLEEVGKQISLSRNTVEKYLDLLEKVFVIYKVPGFSRNLRKETTKTNRWYFYDNGIRNALIANFNPIILRNDIGELWENYVLSERIKYQSYKGIISNNYFWRTYTQNEIDWVEERDGNLFAYEIKWTTNKKAKIPKEWKEAYPESHFAVITPENYLDFII